MGTAADEPDAVGVLLRGNADLGSRRVANVVGNSLRGARDVHLGIGDPYVKPVAAARPKRVVALVGVNVERELRPRARRRGFFASPALTILLYAGFLVQRNRCYPTMSNLPDDLRLAIQAGRGPCGNLLEPW
jgi:hypothetical protein